MLHAHAKWLLIQIISVNISIKKSNELRLLGDNKNRLRIESSELVSESHCKIKHEFSQNL